MGGWSQITAPTDPEALNPKPPCRKSPVPAPPLMRLEPTNLHSAINPSACVFNLCKGSIRGLGGFSKLQNGFLGSRTL